MKDSETVRVIKKDNIVTITYPYKHNEITVLEKDNGIMIVFPYAHVIEQEPGLYYIATNTSRGIRWGIMHNSKIVVKPIYSAIGPFSNGLIAVQYNDGKWGYINKRGELIIEHKYLFAGVFLYGYAEVSIDGTNKFYIDMNGNKTEIIKT